jgi:predicted PurR-regulated permease PerM
MDEHHDRARVASLSFYGILALVGYFVFRLFQPFLAPLCWAGVFVVCLYPLHARLMRWLGPPAAAGVSTAAVTLLLVAPAVSIATAFVREAANARDMVQAALTADNLSQVQGIWQWVQVQLPGQWPQDLGVLARDAGTRAAGIVASRAGGLLRDVAAFLFNLVIMLFATFFLFRDAGTVVDAMRRALPFSPGQTEHVLHQARDLIFASVVASLVVATLQGTVGGLAFWMLGIGAPVFWGVVMAFFSLIPIAGAWLIWGPAAIALLVGGEVGRGIALIAIGVGVVGLVDNVVRPMLLSGKAQMNGLLIFVSLIGGVAVFGLLGVVLGPIIMATAITLFDAYTSRQADAAAEHPA